ncbi:MAG: VTT domain-containing protein [Actinomyces sp.]|uniref:DedA family protein n=1 Tax=Actinomyces sp. TaxID=29317 RepID=UPI0026DA7890|nr:VTT domain-containing protein [Actinomyces sp.]MDO4242602.1 VTT domain-containing protein [Actinomyces sp.]
MMHRIGDLPYTWVFLLFWSGGMMRSNTIYWIGRSITAGTARSRWSTMLDSPMYLTAQSWTARWGVLAVPLSFLTIGLQSFIQLSAGVARMPLRRYVPATAVGAVAWATIYTTIGMAVLAAWYSSPAGRVVSVVLVGVVIGSVILQRRRAEEAARARGHASPVGSGAR